jgi:uncharacterized protein (DUF1501 family)
MKHPLSRRSFLGQANCAAISSLPVLNTLLNLKVAGSLAAAAPGPTDYRALVCLFFSGGMDSFNLLVPRGNTEWGQYRTTRGDVALPQESLLALNPSVSAGLDLGLHPKLPGIQGLFNAGKAAWVTNVGSLIEPITKLDWENDSKAFPLGLFSHSDQIEQWQTSMPHVRSSKGWAGRAADLLQSLNSVGSSSMNISLTGTNIWQSGESAFEYSINTDGAEPLYGFNPAETSEYSSTLYRSRAIQDQLAFDYQHLLTNSFATKKRKAIEAYQQFNEATDIDLPTNIIWPNGYLSSQLQMVAKTIAAHSALGHVRQTFFVEIGGWDHHDGLIEKQDEQLPQVDAAIKFFYDTLTALNLDDKVTTFSASDFGRSLSSDGDGSDHAWGGNHFVIGGAVQGQRIYGEYPSVVLDSPLDVGRGRLIPQISVDSYVAELALWLGVPASSLSQVLPNIGNFYNTSSGQPPVGFMG